MADRFKSCSVDGCNTNAHRDAEGRRGFCNSHYHRFMRHGDPEGGRASPNELQKFYEENVISYDGNDCLIWPYGRDVDGYGKMTRDGKTRIVSRILCEDVNGPSPTSRHQAAHECGNGAHGCVSKRHISWKTPAENTADKIIHGTALIGEKNHFAKLVEVQVREIISLRGKEKRYETASRYGITKHAVASIQQGKSWKHVYDEMVMQPLKKAS